ncbi:MAG: alkaline phosphatase family protein [Chloroflexi bacterium]|nr:alkaline phosphatase family protein [Chloroflexota bacterium]
MENARARAAVATARFSGHFRPPLADYSFARIPQTVCWLLTGNGTPALPLDTLGPAAIRWETVILLFVDSFGWEFFEQTREHFPALRRFDQEGVVSPLTSQFPSTTAVHVTTIHTGLTVGQHGVVEWNYYEPLLDRVISPLPFRGAEEHEGRDSLLATGADPALLFEWETLYGPLQQEGVSTVLYQPAGITSAYSRRVFAGATVRFYTTPAEGLTSLAEEVLHGSGQRYFQLYYAGIDTVAHLHGPQSPQVAAELASFWETVERTLIRPLLGRAHRTLLLVTADHGHTRANVERPFYVNREAPEIVPLLRRTRAGRPIVPGGSPPDLFLYVQPEHLETVDELLSRRLEGIGEVHRTHDLIAAGFFGEPPFCANFLARLGDLIVLAYPGQAVWWYEPGAFEVRLRGHHGGLSPAEMDTLLLVLPLA